MPRNTKDDPKLPCGLTFCPAALRVLWADPGISVRKMERPLGVTGTAIRYRADLLGIRNQRSRRAIYAYSRKAFIETWNDRSLTRSQVAERFGMTSHSAGRHAAALGLKGRPGGRGHVTWRSDFSAMWLAGVRTADIATLHRCDDSTVHVQARKQGLEHRPHRFKGIPLSRYRAALAETRLAENMALSARVTTLAFEITGRETRRHFVELKRLVA